MAPLVGVSARVICFRIGVTFALDGNFDAESFDLPYSCHLSQYFYVKLALLSDSRPLLIAITNLSSEGHKL